MISNNDLSKDELHDEYIQLLDSYQSLLIESSKVTKIGDINQKKLFEVNSEVEKQRQALYKLSITDYLTDIYNRRYILEALNAEFSKSKRYSFGLSCIMIDVDNFKSINDNYGHQAGDFTLTKICDIIKSIIRKVDIFGRYGGEEFLIVLPNTEVNDAVIVAEKIRKDIEQVEFEPDNKELDSFAITISLGVTDIYTGSPKTEEELLSYADKALNLAKKTGKNQYIIYSKPGC